MRRQPFAWRTGLLPIADTALESSTEEDLRGLTARQIQVLRLSARRRTAKQIAEELDISPSRVSQHIGNLKRHFGVNDLAGLFDAHQQLGEPCEELPSHKNQLPQAPSTDQWRGGAYPAQVRFSDAGAFRPPAPWVSDNREWEGSGALDGPGAGVKRIIAVVAIAFALPLLIVLTLTAMSAVTWMATPAP